MSGNNDATRAMTMGGKLPKGMTGCWTLKGKTRIGCNRKHPVTAKQKAKGRKK